LQVVYDYTIEPHDTDPIVKSVGIAIKQFSDAVVPGKWAVDILPFIEHLPEWLPGSMHGRVRIHTRLLVCTCGACGI
jgi:hypothetical protein